MSDFWIGVAGRDHVLLGVQGGFCQLGHGKAAPLQRLEPGDRIIYYSPRERIDGGAPVQAFTALGEPHQVDAGPGFKPYRRAAHYFQASEVSVRPLLLAFPSPVIARPGATSSAVASSVSRRKITASSHKLWALSSGL